MSNIEEKSYDEMLKYVIDNNGNCFSRDCGWCAIKRFCYEQQKNYFPYDQPGFIEAFKKEYERYEK